MWQFFCSSPRLLTCRNCDRPPCEQTENPPDRALQSIGNTFAKPRLNPSHNPTVEKPLRNPCFWYRTNNVDPGIGVEASLEIRADVRRMRQWKADSAEAEDRSVWAHATPGTITSMYGDKSHPFAEKGRFSESKLRIVYGCAAAMLHPPPAPTQVSQ